MMAGLITLLLALCATQAAQAEVKHARFDHVAHFELIQKAGESVVCTSCHLGDISANAVRPSQKDHTSCDSAGCHANEFYGRDDEGRHMCTVCHENSEPWADMRALKAFPSPRDAAQVYCISFSHRDHAQDASGRAMECSQCHQIGKDGIAYTPPGHVDCASCHDQTGAKPFMSQCQGCHTLSNPQGSPIRCSPTVSWRSRKMVGRFSHEQHRIDIRKKDKPVLDCDFCHSEVRKATTVRGIQLLQGVRTMERACGACHNGRTRVPETRRRVFSTDANCSRCHGEGFVQFQAFGTPPPGH